MTKRVKKAMVSAGEEEGEFGQMPLPPPSRKPTGVIKSRNSNVVESTNTVLVIETLLTVSSVSAKIHTRTVLKHGSIQCTRIYPVQSIIQRDGLEQAR